MDMALVVDQWSDPSRPPALRRCSVEERSSDPQRMPACQLLRGSKGSRSAYNQSQLLVALHR